MHTPRVPNEIDVRVGTNLRMLRTEQKISQQYLGECVGITFQQIQKYESGANRIGASRLWQFCDIFNVQPNVFFEGVGALDTKANSEDAGLTDFITNPRGAKAAKAFIEIENPVLEKQMINLMRTMSKKSLADKTSERKD